MRRLFDCPDIVSLTETFFTENNPARGTGKKNNIPDVNWLMKYSKFSFVFYYLIAGKIYPAYLKKTWLELC